MSTKTKPASSMPSVLGHTTLLTEEGQFLYIPKRTHDFVKSLVKKGRPVALIGEPGAGKTDYARALMQAALVAGYIKASYQMEYGGIMSGDQLDGERTLDDKGKLTVVPSQFLLALRSAASGTPTGLIHDEHNRATPSGLNKQLRMSHNEYVSDLDGVLKWSPTDLVQISTLNIGYGHTGTNRVDDALINRFYPIRLHTPTREVAEQILKDRFPKLDKDAAEGILFAYDISRTKDECYRMGMRDVLRLADGIDSGLTLSESISELIGAAAEMQGLPEESVESLITAIASIEK